MSSASLTRNGFGKSPAIRDGGRFPHIGETSRAIANAINDMFQNPAVALGDFLGLSDKTAKRKLDLERSLSVEELGALIRSDRGLEIVSAIMGDARPEWWRICEAVMDAADIRKMQIAAQRRIAKTLAGAIDADRDLTAAIQRAEALAVHDPEHLGNHLDALRSMARVPDRAVASTPSKGRCA